MTLLSFPVLTKMAVMILSFLLVFACAQVSASSAATTTTDEDCGKYCGKTCDDLPTAERDDCKVSLDNCDCSITPPKATEGAKGRSYTRTCSGNRYSSRCETRSSSSGFTVGISIAGILGAIIFYACVGGCIYLCVRSSRNSGTVGTYQQPYVGQTQVYGGGGYQQTIQPVPSQPYGTGAYGSSYGAANY